MQRIKRCNSQQSDTIKNDVDPAFANDQYWLLLPFHLVWDGATATDEGQQKRPTGDASARRVVMKYPSEGGYQPGDTWDLYIGADNRIEEIAYHRGAANPPHFVTGIYTDYKKAGPLLSRWITPEWWTESPSGLRLRVCRWS